MQGNDSTPAPDKDSEDKGAGSTPVEHKSAPKAPVHDDTDQNPDKV